MGPRQFGEFLHALAGLHRTLAAHYAACSERADREALKVQLAHLCRMEQYMEHCVHEYAHSAPKGLRESWLRTTPESDPVRLIRLLPTETDATCDDLLDASVKVQEEFEKMITELIDLADVPDLRAALECLLDLEKQEKTKILRSAGFY